MRISEMRNVVTLAIIMMLFTACSAMAQDNLMSQAKVVEQPQYGSRDMTFRASQFAVYASAASDLATTWRGLSPDRQELNPVLGQSRLRQGTIVMGSAVVMSFATTKLFRAGHPKLATALNFFIAGGHSYAAARNGW